MFKILKNNYKNFLIIFLFIIFSLILTYPLIFNIFTHIQGIPGDSFLFAWNHWWVKHTLFNFQNPYFTDLLAYPFETNLVFHTMTFSNSIVSSFLQIFLPLILSFNIIFILSLTLSCFGMYLFSKYMFNNIYIAKANLFYL